MDEVNQGVGVPEALMIHLNQNSGCLEVGNGLKRGRRELLEAMKMVYILIDVWITQMCGLHRCVHLSGLMDL